MKYHYTRSIGANYNKENEVAIDARTVHGTWKKIESGLKAEMATLRTLERDDSNFRAQAKKSVDGSESDLSTAKNFFNRSADKEKALAETKARINNYREWLRREGVSADASGKVKIPLQKTLVQYDTELAKQGMTRVEAENGKLYIGTGADRKLLDTSDMVSHTSGPGYAIYVMSAEGHIHVGSHVVGLYHHSSLLPKKNVAGAGEIQAKQGALKFVSNKSGHFVPEAKHFNQVLHSLDKMQQNQCIVKYWYEVPKADKSGMDAKQSDFASVSDYRNSFAPGERSEYELAKLLGHSGYIWDKKDNLNPRFADKGWRWADIIRGETPGFYDKDGKAIEHKTVRQFIKEDKSPDAEPGRSDGEVKLEGGYDGYS